MKNLKNYYQKKFKEYGPVPQGVGWSKNKKSKRRYITIVKLLDQIDDKKKIYSLLDVGCGYGELIKYIPKKYNINYLGVDIVEDMIKFAKKKYNKKNTIAFRNANFFKIKKKYDFIVCNGIFTLKNNLCNKKMNSYLIKSIKFFNKMSKVGFCFNIMSDRVDYKSKILYYPSLKRILDNLCKMKITDIYIDSTNVSYEKFIFVKK